MQWSAITPCRVSWRQKKCFSVGQANTVVDLRPM